MISKSRHRLRAVGLIGVFLFAWALAGFIPAFPLFQGRVLIGRLPLFAAWWMSRWTGMALHLLLAASITWIIAIVWRLGSNNWRFSLKTLLLLTTLVSTAIGIYFSLTGVMTFRNG
jgi:hypothetical protein